MNHGAGYRKLGRPSDHRRAMLRNLVRALLIHGRIETTVPRAKETRRTDDYLSQTEHPPRPTPSTRFPK